MKTLGLICAATIVATVPDSPEVLGDSLLNEVDHALSRVPSPPARTAPAVPQDVFGTNGLSATAIAVRLVSLQRADGGWTVDGTNRTEEAVRILTTVSGLTDPRTEAAK